MKKNEKYILIIIGYKIINNDTNINEIGSFFRKIIGNPIDILIFDSSDAECYGNQYYEFGGIKRAIDFISKNCLFNLNIFIVNTTVIKYHSKIFIQYLIEDGTKWMKNIKCNTSKNLIYGEVQKSKYDLENYIATYFMLINLREPININLLKNNINTLTPFKIIIKNINKDYRRYVFKWISGKFLKGWYGASFGLANIKKNYKRKLIAMHYEKIFYFEIMNAEFIINSYKTEACCYKKLDLLKNYMIKCRNRIKAYYMYCIEK